jgi:hypothetical protein
MIARFKAWTRTDIAHDIAHVSLSVAITEGLIQLTGQVSLIHDRLLQYPLLCALPAILVGLYREFVHDLNPSLRDLAGWVVPAVLLGAGHVVWRMM